VPTGYTGPTTSIPAAITLNESSIAGPGFWSDTAYQPASGTTPPAAVLAWTGTNRSHSLNVETSTDGLNYTNKVVLSESSITRPSVIVVPSSTSNVVVLGWVGTNSSHSLNVIYDVYGSRQKLVLPYSSSYTPSLAYFGGQVWMAWTGTDSKHTLNVVALGAKGQAPGAHVTLSGDASNAAPDLVADPLDNVLLLSWQIPVTNQLNFVQSTNGANWTAGLPSPSGWTTRTSPSMMVIDPAPSGMPAYYWSWTSATSNKALNVMPSNALGTWSQPPNILSESGIDSLSLGYAGQQNQILIAWTGTNRAHNLNVGILPV
jgi:hypothetical protein